MICVVRVDAGSLVHIVWTWDGNKRFAGLPADEVHDRPSNNKEGVINKEGIVKTPTSMASWKVGVLSASDQVKASLEDELSA